MTRTALLLALLATPAAATPPPPSPEVVLHDLSIRVNEARMKATV